MFAAGTEWVNVYDPTDPVGTWITDFDPKITPGHQKAVLKPQNFACRASPILLLSHIRYLNGSVTPRTRLVDQVAHWLVDGGSLAAGINTALKGSSPFWIPLARSGGPSLRMRLRAYWRYVQWIIGAGALTVLTLLSLHQVVYPLVMLVYGWVARVLPH